MLKKYLDFFERDKSGFSKEELEWQKSHSNILGRISFFLIMAMICLPQLPILDSNNPVIIFICIEIEIMLGISFLKTQIIGDKIVESINSRLEKIEQEEEEETRRKRKEERIQKIFEKIQNQEFSDLRICDEEIKQRAVQECLKTGKIKLTKEPYGAKIVIEDNFVVDGCCIPKEQFKIPEEDILKYFY